MLKLYIIFGQFPEMLPMAIFASTDFTQVNSSNYMFTKQPLILLLVTLRLQILLTLKRQIIWKTQEAGNTISFYQRGVLLGRNQSSDIKCLC